MSPGVVSFLPGEFRGKSGGTCFASDQPSRARSEHQLVHLRGVYRVIMPLVALGVKGFGILWTDIFGILDASLTPCMAAPGGIIRQPAGWVLGASRLKNLFAHSGLAAPITVVKFHT
jgi:hypothetical protein